MQHTNTYIHVNVHAIYAASRCNNVTHIHLYNNIPRTCERTTCAHKNTHAYTHTYIHIHTGTYIQVHTYRYKHAIHKHVPIPTSCSSPSPRLSSLRLTGLPSRPIDTSLPPKTQVPTEGKGYPLGSLASPWWSRAEERLKGAQHTWGMISQSGLGKQAHWSDSTGVISHQDSGST